MRYIPTGSVFPNTDEKLLSLTKAADCDWAGAPLCDEIPLKPRRFLSFIQILFLKNFDTRSCFSWTSIDVQLKIEIYAKIRNNVVMCDR